MNIKGLEHIEEPFHWGVAVSLMVDGFKVTDPSTPVDDYIYYDSKVKKYFSVYEQNVEEKIFSAGEKKASNYKIVK